MPELPMSDMPTPDITVQIQDAREDGNSEIPSDDDFKCWVSLVVKDKMTDDNAGGGVTVRIVDRDEMQRLNHDFRQVNKPTNVLAFAYNDHPEDYLGDIVICAALVVAEAQERLIPVRHHWAHLVIHGVLHLLGYDHETPQQATEMEPLETALLATLNIANPYQSLPES